MRVVRAIDLYIGRPGPPGPQALDARQLRAAAVRLLATCCPDECLATEIRIEDYERFLNRWVGKSPSTLASGTSLVKGFSRYLYKRGYAEADVAAQLERPRRQRPEDLDVITVSGQEVETDARGLRGLAGARSASRPPSTWGPAVRRWPGSGWGDVDLVNGTIRFVEKGGKVSVKPLPLEYHKLLSTPRRGQLLELTGGVSDSKPAPSVRASGRALATRSYGIRYGS